MQVVIMAGGKGTRVASVKADVPKPMLRVAGKPVLEHQIECLRRQGFHDIILAIGYLGEQIEEYFGDGSQFGVQIEYIREDQPLGTAGALYYLRNRVQDDFVLLNGDLIFDVDLKKMVCFHIAHQAQATIFVHPNTHPYDSGIIVKDKTGRVTGWLTKEDERSWFKNCVNAGIHILSPNVVSQWDTLQKMDLDRDLLKPMIEQGELFAYQSPEYVKDMGTPDRIAEVERDITSGLVIFKNLLCPQRAIFIDRDGTINQSVGFLKDIDKFELIDGASKAIQRINQSGMLAIVITNQPVIARGEVSWEELDEIHNKMETLLGQEGAYLDGIFVCPHHPDRGFEGERPEYKIECDCRKPKPGLILQAAQRFHINLSESWMVGDSESDVRAGEKAGCRTLLLNDSFSLYDAIEQIGL